MNVREELKAYADRELAPDQMESVAKILGEEPALREELGQLETIGAVIREAAPALEPAGLEATLAKLATAKKPSTAWWTGRWPRIAMSALGIFVVGGIILPTMFQAKSAAKNMEMLDGVSAASVSTQAPASDMPAEAATLDGDALAGGGFRNQTKAASPSMEAPARAKSYANERSMPTPGSPADTTVGMPSAGLVIRTGTMGVRVDDAEKAQQTTIRLAREVLGFVQDANLNKADEGAVTSYVTLRVPELRFEMTMDRIAKLGQVTLRQVTGTDVTAQVVDTEARLRTLKIEEEQYRTLLKATRRIGDILIVKDRLGQVRSEIEQMDAQRKNLRSQAAYSTIQVSFEERERVPGPKVNNTWESEAWANAINRLSVVGQFLGKALINVCVFTPVWLPMAIIVWLIARRRA